MANRRSQSVPPATHQPTISGELALKRLQTFLEQIPEIRASGHGSAPFSTWEKNAKIVLAELYGESSLIFKEFGRIWFTPGGSYPGQPDSEWVEAFNSGLDQAAGFLQSRISDLRERLGERTAASTAFSPTQPDGRRIFVVHGHSHGQKETVARFLGKLGLEPIILHEQADQGRTLIEKFESHAAEAQCAVVILTADDSATSKASPGVSELRARQNVIFELGFFVGRLGRQRTFALVEKGVTLPSDIHGVVYIPLDDGEWSLRLVRELKAAGLDVDANRAF